MSRIDITGSFSLALLALLLLVFERRVGFEFLAPLTPRPRSLRACRSSLVVFAAVLFIFSLSPFPLPPADNMSDKAEPAVVSGTPVKPKKRQTCMRHCKRFWWIYLIVFICIVVLVVCLV